jgi:hypothetical protein
VSFLFLNLACFVGHFTYKLKERQNPEDHDRLIHTNSHNGMESNERIMSLKCRVTCSSVISFSTDDGLIRLQIISVCKKYAEICIINIDAQRKDSRVHLQITN